ncbi:MAG: hypothetical protein V8K32_13125 [Candidatus Electrothrix gigas]
MKYAIALKDKSKYNPQIGEVKPYVKEENKKFSAVTSDDFPQKGLIFVSGGYDQLNEKFDDNELFRIEYNEADFIEKDSSDPRYCLYRASGKDAKKLRSLELFHIVDKNVDFEKRQILSLAYKPTRDIFVTRAEFPGYLFGPFQHSSSRDSDGNYTVSLKVYPSLQHCINSSGDWSILKVQKDTFKILDIGFQKIWLCSIQDLARKEYEIQDFISKEQLVKWANNLVPPSEEDITKGELNKLKNIISYIEHQEKEVPEARLKQLYEIFDELKVWREDRSTLIDKFLSTEKGQISIDQYLDNNSQKFEDQLKEKYGAKEEDYKKRISELEEKKQEAESSLARLQNELEATQNSVTQRQQKKLDKKHLELQSEVENLRNQRNELIENLDDISQIGELKDDVKYLERKKNDLRTTCSNLDSQKIKLSQGILNEQAKLLDKLTELKPYIDILNGLEINADQSIKPHKNVNRRKDAPGTLKEFISEIQGNLIKYGRYYNTESLANYLISIHQSFLTIFAGLPGIGKTSLVTYLSQSLGLESNERFLFIPVARGWTSQKNLLGFFNPLNGKFQPSATGMYEALNHIQNEEKNYPYWFLLDEANLSPIEHYWSSFMAMCDTHREKIIKIGDQNINNFRIPNSVRFIATINNDNTTELLSPRIIDRVPIITIQHVKTPEEKIELPDNSEISVPYVLPQDALDKLFTPSKEKGFDSDEKDVFNDVVKCLETDSENLPVVPVSPRKRKIIEEYCTLARDLMQEKYGQRRSLDIAISQHILPAINGNGGAYRQRLEKLEKVLYEKDLTHSHSMLQKIIVTGEFQYDFYRFLMQ